MISSPCLKRSAPSPLSSSSKMTKSDVDSDNESDSSDSVSVPDFDRTMLNNPDYGGWSIESRKRISSKRKSTSNSQLPQDAKEFPVFLEDIGDDNDPHYRSYGQFTNGLFKSINVNDVCRQRRISTGKWLIYVKSIESQNKLVATSDLAGIKIKCEIPHNNAVGVIKPIPTSINMEQIKVSCPSIKDAFRLKNKEGKESTAIKIVFKENQLPNEIKIGNEIMAVNVFIEPVIRCSRCQKLNHKKSQCRAKEPICPRCGKPAHDPNNPENNISLCTVSVDKRFCVNCKVTGHSAAWKGCPSQQVQKKINTEAAKSGVPRGVAKHNIQAAINRENNAHTFLNPQMQSTPLAHSSTHRSVEPTLQYAAVVKSSQFTDASNPHLNQGNKDLQNVNEKCDMIATLSKMFESFENKIDEKMNSLEQKIMSNLACKRKDQISYLKVEVDAISVDKPLKHIVANLIKDVVLASEGNTGPLIDRINNLVSERCLSSCVEPLIWDSDLENILQLAIPTFKAS